MSRSSAVRLGSRFGGSEVPGSGPRSALHSGFVCGLVLAMSLAGVSAPLSGGALARSVTPLSARSAAKSAVSLQLVSCPTPTRCVAMGDNARGVVSIVSTNGGLSWTKPTVTLAWPSYKLLAGAPGSTMGDMSGLSCVGTFCIGIGTLELRNGNPLEALLVTSHSGGHRWSSVRPVPGVQAFDEVTCATASMCVASAFPRPASGGVLLTTSNGGKSWRSTSGLSIPGVSGSEFTNTVCTVGPTCKVLSTDFLYTAGGASPKIPLAKSTGALRSWTVTTGTLTSPPSPPIPSYDVQGLDVGELACPSIEICLVAGEVTDTASPVPNAPFDVVIRTLNGGTTWSLAQLPSIPPSTGMGGSRFAELAFGLACPNLSNCLLVGGAAGQLASVLVTHDGGASWTRGPRISPTGKRPAAGEAPILMGISCPTQHRCVVVGDSLPADTLGFVMGGFRPTPYMVDLSPYTGVVSI